jgi:hypothetical protein
MTSHAVLDCAVLCCAVLCWTVYDDMIVQVMAQSVLTDGFEKAETVPKFHVSPYLKKTLHKKNKEVPPSPQQPAFDWSLGLHCGDSHTLLSSGQ